MQGDCQLKSLENMGFFGRIDEQSFVFSGEDADLAKCPSPGQWVFFMP
jgi:hypothetical protein